MFNNHMMYYVTPRYNPIKKDIKRKSFPNNSFFETLPVNLWSTTRVHSTTDESSPRPGNRQHGEKICRGVPRRAGRRGVAAVVKYSAAKHINNTGQG